MLRSAWGLLAQRGFALAAGAAAGAPVAAACWEILRRSEEWTNTQPT